MTPDEFSEVFFEWAIAIGGCAIIAALVLFFVVYAVRLIIEFWMER